LAAKKRLWKGTASELDGHLRAIAGILDTAPQVWPADPARLATKLRQLAPSLNKVGIAVTFTRDGHDRTRLITISVRTGEPDSPNSPSAPSAAGASQQNAALETVDSAEQDCNADGADGPRAVLP
jgi:hypothetical protein